METEINVSVSTGKITLTRNDGEPKDISSHIGLIESQLELLIFYRDDGRTPSKLLLDDIAAYKWLLKQDENKMSEYFKVKDELRKKEEWPTNSGTCKMIGWKK